jgi:large repetitive protein
MRGNGVSWDEERRRRRERLRVLLVLLVGLAVAVTLVLQRAEFAAGAHASFIVNSAGTATDSRPGDGVCATSSGVCTLRAAIHEANAHGGDDSIQLPAGTYPISRPSGSGIATGDLDIERPVSITGAGAAGTIIDGGGLDRVIEVRPTATRVDISGVTVRGGSHPEAGAGILNAGGATLTVADSLILNNVATKFGGGVANEAGGTVRLVNGTRLSGNSAREGGSAASNAAQGKIEITDSAVSSNGAVDINGYPDSGPAILNRGLGSSSGSLVLTRADVLDNVAGSSIGGGGIGNSGDGDVEIADSTISGNQALYSIGGGGISNSGDGDVEVTEDSVLSGNRAVYSGGAIDNSGRGEVRIAGSTISGNHAGSADSGNDETGDGGGIDNLGEGQLTIRASTVSANTAGAEGGGVRSGGKADLTVTEGSEISGNSAGSGGGIHAGGDGDVAVSDAILASNEAADGAGMLGEATSAGGLTLTRVELSYNQATGDGGGLLLTSGSATIVASDFEGNSAGIFEDVGGGGGGLANHAGGEVRVEDSNFIGNVTSARGGGIASVGDGPFTVTGTTLSENQAADGGGLSSNADAAFTVENSTVSGNTATTAGGGAVVLDSMTLSSTTVTGNSAPSGGGIEKLGDSALFMKNTIVASNEGGNCGYEPGTAAITSLGGNLDSGTSCTLAGEGDLSSTDPELGPLQDNGGRTWTHALEPGSHAIDRGLAENCPATDQRGIERPQGEGCDMGAYERAPSSEDPPSSCAARQTQVLAADADSWIFQGDQGKNLGSDGALKVVSKDGGNSRALVRFELPPIPTGCTVISATLRLHAGGGTEGRTLEAVRLLSGWTESGVTWSNQPGTGGAPATTPSGTGARAWTVKKLVDEMYGSGNHGFLIRDAAEGETGVEQSFNSREKAADNPPRLEITFG